MTAGSWLRDDALFEATSLSFAGASRPRHDEMALNCWQERNALEGDGVHGFAKGWTGEVETAEVGKNGRSRVGPSIAKLS